ncbi:MULTISPECIES: SLATT domain-containing protein [unclassified Pseudomonas]|uniref:SLATT domain-containing protein n=1 Tax=unclassified Pseudomonas TaxID=196821 RepID=UPI0011EC258E|nr:SLATT domain-containing protein [Pseudomonas sp. ANT_H4]KAA0950876.1 SLATT domain-containing protein [Pseudomonas sp. ANT_H14]
MSHINTLDELRTKIWKTKGARFNASRRLQARKVWGGYLVSAFSIYILAIGIFSLTETHTNPTLNLSSIIGSLLILVFSLHEGSLNAEQKAERHHVCAKDLTALYDKVSLQIQIAETSKAEALIEEYARIIDRSPENHDLIDYKLFKTEHKDFKVSCLTALKIEFKYYSFQTACTLLITTPLILLSIFYVMHQSPAV